MNGKRGEKIVSIMKERINERKERNERNKVKRKRGWNNLEERV